MGAKHTPGPWRFSDTMGGAQVTTSRIGILEGSKRICTISDFDKEVRVIHANGKLIAAAPDLLEACQRFMDLFSDCDMRPEDESHEVATIIRAAISKATGGSEP